MSAIDGVSEIFDTEQWTPVPGFDELTDLTYHRAKEHGTVRIAFDRPDVLNAFRPHTVDELLRALEHARTSADVGCVILTGNGPSPKSGKWSFCTGGDQRIRGRAGYQYETDNEAASGLVTGASAPSSTSGDAEVENAAEVEERAEVEARGAGGERSDRRLVAQQPSRDRSSDTGAEKPNPIDQAKLARLHILECQRLIRFMPKVVICVVPGWAAGGGHSLHVVCDLTLASAEHARFKQTDADVGSFDGGYGSAYLARQVGQKFAREIFLLGQEYSADDGVRMGTVNRAVPHAELESTALEWGRLVNGKSPTAQRMLKYAFNLPDDGLAGQQLFAGEATRLAYMTDEAQEGRDQFLEKREPDWSPFPWYY